MGLLGVENLLWGFMVIDLRRVVIIWDGLVRGCYGISQNQVEHKILAKIKKPYFYCNKGSIFSVIHPLTKN